MPAALGKTLWTSGADGERVKLYAAFNERDEADFVVNRIREWVERGGARREVAVLYRSNAQSRVFEEAFLNARMPYRVYGGLRFFERAEIKDALAYLRLIANRARRYLVRARGEPADARHRREDLGCAARHGARAGHLAVGGGRARASQRRPCAARGAGAAGLHAGRSTSWREEIRGLELHEQVDHVIQASGLIEHYKKEKAERGEAASRTCSSS